MKTSDITFKLVKSLTKSEKRYFRLSAALTEGDKNYLQIFEAMQKQETYDEKKLKASFANKKLVQHFTYEKSYLQKMLLKTLRNYGSSEELNDIHTMADIAILMKRGMPEAALPLIKKYKKKALEVENLPEYIIYARSEMRLASATQDTGWFADYIRQGFFADAALIDQWKHSVFIITKFNELNILKGTYKFVNNADLQQQLGHMMQAHEWDGLFDKLGRKGKIAWFNFFTHYYLLLKEYENAYRNSNNQLAYIKKRGLTIETIGYFNYPVILFNHIETVSILEKYEEVNEYCAELNKLIHEKAYDSVPHIRNQFKVTYIQASIINFTHWKKFSQCLTFYQQSKAEIAALLPFSGNEFPVTVQYYIALSNFGLGKYKAALDHLDIVLAQKETANYAMQIIPAQVLFIMSHLELGNIEFVLNHLRTFKRFFNKQITDINTVTILIRIFREYAAVHHDTAALRIAAEKWQELTQQLKKNADEKIFLRNTLMEHWISLKQA